MMVNLKKIVKYNMKEPNKEEQLQEQNLKKNFLKIIIKIFLFLFQINKNHRVKKMDLVKKVNKKH